MRRSGDGPVTGRRVGHDSRIVFDPYPGNPAICVASDDGRYVGTAAGSAFVHIVDTASGNTIAKTHDREAAADFICRLMDAERHAEGCDMGSDCSCGD